MSILICTENSLLKDVYCKNSWESKRNKNEFQQLYNHTLLNIYSVIINPIDQN